MSNDLLYTVYKDNNMTISLPQDDDSKRYSLKVRNLNRKYLLIEQDGKQHILEKQKGKYIFKNGKLIKIDFLKNKIAKVREIIK